MTTRMEREIKLRFDSAEAARAAVLKTGATLVHGRRLQDDAILDTGTEALRRERRSLLRVRIETEKSSLTFKGPVQPSTMKLREEVETIVGDGPSLLQILQELDFRIWFRYQKYREEFSLKDVIVAIDETPIGTFVEIEGDERGIADTALALGRG